jgi:hypothetical protein
MYIKVRYLTEPTKEGLPRVAGLLSNLVEVQPGTFRLQSTPCPYYTYDLRDFCNLILRAVGCTKEEANIYDIQLLEELKRLKVDRLNDLKTTMNFSVQYMRDRARGYKVIPLMQKVKRLQDMAARLEDDINAEDAINIYAKTTQIQKDAIDIHNSFVEWQDGEVFVNESVKNYV